MPRRRGCRKNLPQPPTYAKANANGFPIMALALTSDAYDTPAIFDYADTVSRRSCRRSRASPPSSSAAAAGRPSASRSIRARSRT